MSDACLNTCKTCKHWGQMPPLSRWGTETDTQESREWVCYDADGPMIMPYKAKRCGMPTQTFCEFPVEANGFALKDGSTYFAALYTGEDFGCVRHEEVDR